MGGKYLLVLPPDRLSGGKGLGHIQQPLVPAAPEAEGDVVLGLHKAAVHQHIQQAQQLVGDFAPGVAGDRPGQLLPSTALPLQHPVRTAYRHCAARVPQTRAAAHPAPHPPHRGQSSPLQSPAQSPDQKASVHRTQRPSRPQIPLPQPPACALPGAALPAVPVLPAVCSAARPLPDPSALS